MMPRRCRWLAGLLTRLYRQRDLRSRHVLRQQHRQGIHLDRPRCRLGRTDRASLLVVLVAGPTCREDPAFDFRLDLGNLVA